MRRALIAALALLIGGRARLAAACASCGCGDPTLTVLGAEKPFAGRLRVGAEVLAQSERSGTPLDDEIALDEQRMNLQVAWAPAARFVLLASLPVVARSVGYVNGGKKRVLGLGDGELRGKAFLWEDRAFSPAHLVAATLGARFPVQAWGRDGQGAAYPPELQPGSGALSPLVGLSYAQFRFPWSGYASVEGAHAILHRADFQPASALAATVAVQRQAGTLLAARLSIDARLDGRVREQGAIDADSGGFVGYLSPAILLTPVTDLLLAATARFPVVASLAGHQRFGPIVSFIAAYDF